MKPQYNFQTTLPPYRRGRSAKPYKQPKIQFRYLMMKAYIGDRYTIDGILNPKMYMFHQFRTVVRVTIHRELDLDA